MTVVTTGSVCMVLSFDGATHGRFLLFTVGDDIPDGRKACDVDVSFIALAASEQLICAMETVQDPKDPIVLVEPVRTKGIG